VRRAEGLEQDAHSLRPHLAIYPTIAQVEDEGLVTTREEGGRRLVTLTSEGRAQLEERRARLGFPCRFRGCTRSS
jgi:DNA-binding PadR family transcriptional regulator